MRISTKYFFLNLFGKNRNGNKVYFAVRIGNKFGNKKFRFSILEKTGVNIEAFGLFCNC